MVKKLDRRIQRTRQLLSDALVSLILEIGYKKITVQNIIDRANVGRSTFYDHFQDKDDLLASGFSELADDLYQHIETPHPHTNNPQHLIHSLDFFRHAHTNRKLYRAMAESGGGELLLDIGRRHMEKNIQAHIKLLAINENDLSVPLPVITNYLAGTLLSLITWWIDERNPYTPEEMNAMFCALAMPGFWQVLETPAK